MRPILKNISELLTEILWRVDLDGAKPLLLVGIEVSFCTD